MLTRKHYAAIAAAIRGSEHYEMHTCRLTRDEIIAALARYFERDNPKFDRQRFIKVATHWDQFRGADYLLLPEEEE